jgi:DNA polymerase III epsilon subunit-like protein
MKTKYTRALVYDLETGGLSLKYNSITEIAMVAVDLTTLEIIDQMQVVFEPYIDLSWIGEPIKDAKIIYKNIGVKDPDTGIKTLKFQGHNITLKNIDPLIEAIGDFYKFLDGETTLTRSFIEELENNSEFKDIAKVFFDNCYNPQALEVTGIGRDLLESEGVNAVEAFDSIKAMIEKHTLGNNKPIIAGHNIGSLTRRIVKGKEVAPDGFDNPFMEKLFNDFNDDWFSSVNDEIIDTLKWSRLKWTEMTSYSLGPVANEVGLTLKEAHRALPDTVANAKFLIQIFRHLRGEGSLKSTYKRRKYNFQM